MYKWHYNLVIHNNYTKQSQSRPHYVWAVVTLLVTADTNLIVATHHGLILKTNLPLSTEYPLISPFWEICHTLYRLCSGWIYIPPPSQSESSVSPCPSLAQTPLVLSPIYQVHQCFMCPVAHQRAAQMSCLSSLCWGRLSKQGPPFHPPGKDLSPLVFYSMMLFQRNVWCLRSPWGKKTIPISLPVLYITLLE